jgi:hypothetical protein
MNLIGMPLLGKSGRAGGGGYLGRSAQCRSGVKQIGGTQTAWDGETRQMKLSIVTTLYHSARYLPQFHERITAEARTITDDYELLLVNDGSPDDSLEIALQILHLRESQRKNSPSPCGRG